MKLLLVLGSIALLAGAVKVAEATRGTATTGPSPSIRTAAERSCAPGDQDPFVYRPERLQFLRPCLRVTGVVRAVFVEDDGDVHLRVALDPPYDALLVEGNHKATDGDLVVEPVCFALALHADALRLCASDPDPVSSVPQVGDHVWMEGRYVLDIGHTAWAELHPLYRWGAVGQ
jgi:hypothetical protein